MAANIRVMVQIGAVDTAIKNRKGICFYCSKHHKYVFIENTNEQNTIYSALKTPKKK